jgi:hypothetical protein
MPKTPASIMEIDNILNDYTLRELQSISSTILSDHVATNNFIKQFNADHDSQQFYKNVITWFVKQYGFFPETGPLTFHFTPNETGLGDRFMIVSTILSLMDALDRDSIVYLLEGVGRKRGRQELDGVSSPSATDCDDREILFYKNFYDIIDFFHFKRPKNKIRTVHKSCKYYDNNGWVTMMDVQQQFHTINNYRNIFEKMTTKTWVDGMYWPIDFSIKEKRKNVCYMLYTDQGPYHNQPDNIWGKNTEKEEIEKFKSLRSTFPEITFYRLEDFNFSRNVEILQMSNFVFSTEGMWTHLSRAMKVDTIAYTVNVDINREINDQGHYSSPSFDECLDKVKNSCTNLMK